MNHVNFDWQYIFKDMRLPCISLLISSCVLGFCVWYYDSQRSVYEVYSSDQQAMHSNYDSLVFRRRLVERYHQRYQAFRDDGFVGKERRLDWITTIRNAARKFDLPNVGYSIEPQLEVVTPLNSVSANADVQVKLSRMKLELGLVHELDMLRFLDHLALEAPGLMKVDRCDLVRQSGNLQELTAEINILATCSVLLYSVITSDTNPAEVGI